MDPETMAQLFASLGMQPPGPDVTGSMAMAGDPNAVQSPYGGLGELLTPGRPSGMSPTGSPTSGGYEPSGTPPGYSGPPPAPTPPVSGPPAPMPSMPSVGGIGNALSAATGINGLPTAQSLPNIIRAPLGLGTDRLPGQDPGGLQGEAGRPQPTGNLTLPEGDPGGLQDQSLGSALNPAPAGPGAPMSLAPPNPGAAGKGPAKATPAAGQKGNPLLDMLKGIAKPTAPEVQKVATPHAPAAPRQTIQSGALQQLFDALNMSQGGQGLKLPPTLMQALGGR